MTPRGLGRRLAALGAGLAMAATMTTTLATPATATATAAAKPKVSAATPKAAPKNHEGTCPVKVTFSAKVKIKPTTSKTRVVYRWLHGDGTKSKVKSYTVKGKSARWITFKESTAFATDVRGWQALQILSPRKVTSKKGYFSVDCHKPPVLEGTRGATWVNAAVSVDRYTTSCSSRVDAVGTIRVGKPSWVHYRWIRNGRVVDSGHVKVRDDRRVHYSFTPYGSHRGWVALEIVRPRHASSNRAYYEVRCEAPAQASARVTAPADYQGSCPVDRRFTGVLDVRGPGTTVRYRWAGPGYSGPLESAYVSGSRSVSHTATASTGGEVQRRIEIVSPGHATSNTASTTVKCVEAPATASISNLATAPDYQTCDRGASPAVKLSADITVTGPATLIYRWVIGGSAPGLPTTVTLDKAGVHRVTGGLTPTGPPTTAGTITLEVSSPNAATATQAFSYTCPAP